jgi:hypothetical protein
MLFYIIDELNNNILFLTLQKSNYYKHFGNNISTNYSNIHKI